MNTSTTFPGDFKDEQWALVELLIPVYPGGRPRKTSTRSVLNAIFYIVKTGIQWRYLPKNYPPKSTVWGYFDGWRHNGTIEKIHDALREQVRRAERPAERTGASIDSQSVDTGEGGESRGRDNAKNVDGRKRNIVVDSLGLLRAVLVTAADVDAAAAAPEGLGQWEDLPLPDLRRVFGDGKYHNHAPHAWVDENGSYKLEIVRRPKGAQGWVLLPIRWTVERTFAWLGRYRRSTVDREKTVRSSIAMVRLAMIHLMPDRLSRKGAQPHFHYRDAV